jgi:pimeloyl-ACP methyl ester carboxylesterase
MAVSQVLRVIRSLLGGILALIVIAACAGAVYQVAASVHDHHKNPPSGELIDVGGYKMHLDCTGQGSPTVILESGLADTWLSWYKVQPEVAHFTRVCSYDRAGMGWSDPSPKPRNGQAIVEELHTLLRNAKIAPPYVMVGHSLGGMYVRLYTHDYPDEVSGVVLVDSSHPDQFERFPHELSVYNDQFLRTLGWKMETMPLGIPRLMHWCGNGAAALRPMLRTIDCQLGPWREHMAEYRSLNVTDAQVRAAGTLGDRPLVVLSHDPGTQAYSPKMTPVWIELQTELTHLSSNSSQVIAEGSGHMIQIDRPDLVIAAIQKVVAECQSKNAVSQIKPSQN